MAASARAARPRRWEGGRLTVDVAQDGGRAGDARRPRRRRRGSTGWGASGPSPRTAASRRAPGTRSRSWVPPRQASRPRWRRRARRGAGPGRARGRRRRRAAHPFPEGVDGGLHDRCRAVSDRRLDQLQRVPVVAVGEVGRAVQRAPSVPVRAAWRIFGPILGPGHGDQAAGVAGTWRAAPLAPCLRPIRDGARSTPAGASSVAAAAASGRNSRSPGRHAACVSDGFALILGPIAARAWLRRRRVRRRPARPHPRGRCRSGPGLGRRGRAQGRCRRP